MLLYETSLIVTDPKNCENDRSFDAKKLKVPKNSWKVDVDRPVPQTNVKCTLCMLIGMPNLEPFANFMFSLI